MVGGEKKDDTGDGSASFSKATRHVRELIGTFDLDPNRVLDLALDALEWDLNEVVTKSAKKQSS
eukprot:scaffold9411_cov76-Alexandrium_tamarense.AAC.1